MAGLHYGLGSGRNKSYESGTRLFDQGRYEDAIDAFRNAQGSGADKMTARLAVFYTGESYAHLGHAAISQADWEKARAYFTEALEVHPQYPDLHLQLSRARRACGELDAALQSAATALAINERFAKAHLHMGLIKYQMGDRDGGLRSICAALEIEPAYRTEAFVSGLNHHLDCSYDAALKSFEQVARTAVDDILFHFKLADDLYKRDLHDRAISEYNKALALNPGYADVHNHLGRAYAAKGLVEEAIAEFQRALAINPKYVDAMVNLATVLRDCGRTAEARALFAQIYVVDEANDRVLAIEDAQPERTEPRERNRHRQQRAA